MRCCCIWFPCIPILDCIWLSFTDDILGILYTFKEPNFFLSETLADVASTFCFDWIFLDDLNSTEEIRGWVWNLLDDCWKLDVTG